MASPPLAGLRVLLTRPESDGADDWFAGLAAAGASPLLYPTVAIVPPESWQPLDEALAKLSEYEWLIFTSQTAVSFVSSRLPDARFPDPMRTRIAAVGPKTAQAVVERGGRVALVPEDNRQEGLARAMAGLPSGTRVLFPFASGGRTHLAEKLRGQGCAVEVVAAGPASLDGKILAVIGPTTEQEALAHGLRPVVARKPDLEALILAIAEARQALGDPHVLS